MKISNSKKQLAQIIHENGGWRDKAESAAQCSNGEISFWHDTATRQSREGWCGNYLGRKHDIEFTGVKLHNWHQTILSRNEYFHLYPAQDADGWIEWKGGECPVEEGTLVDVIWRNGTERVGVKALHIGGAGHKFWVADGMLNDIIAYRLHKPEPEIQSEIMGIAQVGDINVVESKPSIEQLAADYRNAKDFADRKQQEADAAKADAEAKLAELVAAGKAHGLVLSVTGAKSETEQVIIDWRDLQVDDLIWYAGDDELSYGEYYVKAIETPYYEGYRTVMVNGGNGGHWIDTRAGWGFIRRPT